MQLTLWCHKRNIRKIRAIAPRIAGKKRQTFRRRMRANEEIGEDAGPRATTLAIHAEGFCGEKQRRFRDRQKLESCPGDKIIKVFDPLVANCKLSINNIVDQNGACISGGRKL